MGIVKPKQTDLSHLSASNNGGVGLVAAYNMIPSPEGVLVDISGEGINGAITESIKAGEGMKFTGLRGSSVYMQSGQIITTETFTIAGRIKPSSGISATQDQVIFSNANLTNTDTIIDSLGIRDNFIAWNYNSAGTYKSRGQIKCPINEWTNFVLSVNGGRIHSLYINGVLDAAVTGSFYRSGAGSGIGDRNIASAGSNQPYSGDVADLRLFNYAFSEAEAIAYHNSFQKLEKKNVFSDHPVGSTI